MADSDESIDKSFQTLKQTIPLLLKHKISAIPTNYALWYTYATGQCNELNAELDKMIENDRPLSSARAQELHRNYLSDQQEVSTWQLRQSLEAMLVELTQSLTDTRSDTHSFKNTMDICLTDLEKVEREGWSVEEVMTLVREMVRETQQIKRSTLDFTASLASAEKEIDQLRRQLAESQKDALYDGLTGLYNRRVLDEDIAAMEAEQGVCLIMIDIDHFKSINDQYGHQMGDRVLKAIAKRIKDTCRDNAVPYRFGGEEFSVLMTASKLSQAIHQAESMRRTMEKVSVIDRRTGKTLNGITASFGVAEYKKDMRKSDLLEQADKLLYEAKRLGRNRVMPMQN
ncbi:GGDEF domain-containing protein [Lacimicrobium alkaliphilum]|uniref:diguanylate cyclase n=1 Tax=Lacimicrobium alkaliphilum TaxID=1526571 RepID=A0ABQ1RB54_9ALTE|nr:GGDEF domain-containing protein [Lacimicrobium alkaliphilum]GGD64568.1 diguanylate cyclase [Lacimicrobium alkaliphilum]